jgi:MFS family permease
MVSGSGLAVAHDTFYRSKMSMALPRSSALRDILNEPRYLRLWIAGGIGNAMRWFETLVAGVFVYEVTQSPLLVSLTLMSRALPLLFVGAVAGAVADAINRRSLLLIGLLVTAVNAALMALEAAFGNLQVWQVALGGIISGGFWAFEMAVRRRMISEVVRPDLVGPAIALDAVTGSATRAVGPLLGGVMLQTIGLAWAFGLSALLMFGAAAIIFGLAFTQESRPLRLARLPAEIAEGIATARAQPILLGVLLATIVMNAFGFSYTAMVAPFGAQAFNASPAMIGLLAAAEPLGSIITGLILASGRVPMDRPRLLIRGSYLFLAGGAAAMLAPWYLAAFILLALGGLGTAAFASMQSTLILTHAPAAMRSRVMGLITVCIGAGPIGVMLVGLIAEVVGAGPAILIMMISGILLLGAIHLRSRAVWR